MCKMYGYIFRIVRNAYTTCLHINKKVKQEKVKIDRRVIYIYEINFLKQWFIV